MIINLLENTSRENQIIWPYKKLLKNGKLEAKKALKFKNLEINNVKKNSD